jgi:hypothetical protein
MFDLPFSLPAGDPSTMSQILVGFAPTGEPIVSVVFGMSFDVVAGKLVGKRGFEIQREWVHTPAEVRCRRTRPSLLVRDIDTYVWRNFTDLVVRGTARSEKPRGRQGSCCRQRCRSPRCRCATTRHTAGRTSSPRR